MHDDKEKAKVAYAPPSRSYFAEVGISVLSACLISGVLIYGFHMKERSDNDSLSTDPMDLLAAVSSSDRSDHTDELLCKISGESNKSCVMRSRPTACQIGSGELCEADIDIARIAWKYFENNYQPETGLYNAVNNFPSTTMWDTGSALAATLAAYDFGIIDKKDFDDRIMALFETLSSIELFNGEAPNKVYNTKSRLMVNYANKPVDNGIGVSTLDLARIMSWMNTLSCMHPKYRSPATNILSRWDFERLVTDGSLYGLAIDKKNEKNIRVLQEGRLGYEQYAAKIFEQYGFDLSVASKYQNEHRGNIDIMGVPIAYDTRDPRQFHANNYVVTESYTMDAMELGLDEQNTDLLKSIFEVQKRRWKETGIVTAVSEDNINQAPWFLYNTIFNAGQAWQTTNSSDVAYDSLKTISVKAAMSMAILFPEDEYSAALTEAIESAYDPDKGWYSGIYESGAGFNDVVTANTNGVIMEGLLYKKYGALFDHCTSCSTVLELDSETLRKTKSVVPCELCSVSR